MIKISALPTAGAPTGAELVPVVKSGVTSQTTSQAVANLANIAAITDAATSKATPVDADELPLADSAASYGLKKLLWSNLKATLKTYFDGLYMALVAPGTAGNLLVSNGSAWVSSASAKVNNFRLTLTTGTPVTTSDVTGAGTIYCTPYNGDQISLYTGGAWVTRTSVEFSKALSALTSGKPYDVFCYDNAGTPTLEFLVWTNDTTRATALAYQDGVLVKSGDATRRYLGTFYTTGVATTEDSAANRYLWNYYNRLPRSMKRVDATAGWTYTTLTYRQANGSTANQLNMVIGVSENSVRATVVQATRNDTSAVSTYTAIGLDSTTTVAADSTMAVVNIVTAVQYLTAVANYEGFPGVGKHSLVWLEKSDASGSTLWQGTLAGMTGSLLA